MHVLCVCVCVCVWLCVCGCVCFCVCTRQFASQDTRSAAEVSAQAK